MTVRDGCVIAAFPATGKTTFADGRSSVYDAESSRFSWRYPGSRERHSEWPNNYVDHIREFVNEGLTVLVSTHTEVREALRAAGISFTLVYPTLFQRADYRARMEQRGSPTALIETVIVRLWDRALLECASQTGCVHLVLREGEFLSDVIRRPR